MKLIRPDFAAKSAQTRAKPAQIRQEHSQDELFASNHRAFCYLQQIHAMLLSVGLITDSTIIWDRDTARVCGMNMRRRGSKDSDPRQTLTFCFDPEKKDWFFQYRNKFARASDPEALALQAHKAIAAIERRKLMPLWQAGSSAVALRSV